MTRTRKEGAAERDELRAQLAQKSAAFEVAQERRQELHDHLAEAQKDIARLEDLVRSALDVWSNHNKEGLLEAMRKLDAATATPTERSAGEGE